MNRFSLPIIICALWCVAPPALAETTAHPMKNASPINDFTLQQAIKQALAHSPRLHAFQHSIAAAKGERQQAGIWQNPEIHYSRENVAGGRAYNNLSPRQNSYGFSQLIEVGGKIAAREEIADKGVDIASLDAQTAMLDIIRDITIAYAETIAAEENMRLATEQQALAADVLQSVSVRVEAAAAPLLQKSRAEVEYATAKITLDKANRAYEIARQQLATLMGETHFSLPLDNTDFYTLSKPHLSSLENTLKSTPDSKKRTTHLAQAEAKIALEKANAIPDPRINGGMIEIPSVNDQAFIIGVTLPIPVFNSNRGNIEKARYDKRRTEQENRQMALDIQSQFTQSSEMMENAYMQADTLKMEILPSAEKAFALAREGYELGRFPYLDVLDAQRSLFTVKQQQITALKEFHTAKATVERLTAAHIQMLQGEQE